MCMARRKWQECVDPVPVDEAGYSHLGPGGEWTPPGLCAGYGRLVFSSCMRAPALGSSARRVV